MPTSEPIASAVPVVGFVAPSGTGKTTLLEAVIARLRERGVRVGLIKHTHHRFDIDRPGKDSHRLREAGARQVMVGSRRRWALITERDSDSTEPDLAELLAAMDPARLDLILVEGFKHEAFPKVELHRPALGQPPLFPEDADIIAVATDAPEGLGCPLPLLDLNEPAAIVEFLLARFGPGTG